MPTTVPWPQALLQVGAVAAYLSHPLLLSALISLLSLLKCHLTPLPLLSHPLSLPPPLPHSLSPPLCPGTTPYEILLSYVHRESSNEAISLREALQEAGYRVFLDVECIRSGTDWQDVLNDAVSNCTVFIPLITEQYGQVTLGDSAQQLS